jgi:Flp pilus assembly protein TadG
MKKFGWLRKLREDEGGNALAVAAATMPMLLGAAGLAVDTIQLSVWKRQLQRAADSAAVAGVYGLSQGHDATEAVHHDLDQNRFPTLSTPESVTIGPQGTYQQAVRVQLTSTQRLPFMAIFTSSSQPIQANATAALVSDGTFCVLSLYDGTQPGIDVNGNANVNLGCGMASNSRATQAVTAGGSSLITASPIMSVGGLDGAANNFADGTQLQPNSAEQSDPFAYLPEPAAQSGCTAVRVQSNDDPVTLSPDQCYSSLDISGTVTLEPGTYFVTGDIDFGSQANVTGNGVTFIMTGPGGQAGDLEMNAQATLNLTAPTTGTYANVLFYRDRRAANVEIRINGGASSVLEGALYFPTSDIWINGHAGFQTRCFQLVGQIMTFRGTATLNNSCNRPGGAPGFQLQYVRLIG